jgi:lipopolysaccharide transport system ATP-binding protein
MSSDAVAIRVADLGKCYQIYDRPQDRLKQSLVPRLRRLLGQAEPTYFREFWALRDVSFQVRKGETVGIIGRNGSGKSTLLQVICGTLTPTTGLVETGGRVAALLELGAGFNLDFTGRENVYLNGSVLGLTRGEIDLRFDAIAAFADIGEFIDQPVKTYSSGMVVRLGFAVAIHVDPEILIVDEALAVGDEVFQRKCFSRIEAIKNNGATILFVSHSATTVVELCDWCILLDGGDLITAGPAKTVVGKYQRLIYAPEDRRIAVREEIRQGSIPSLAVVQSSDTPILSQANLIEAGAPEEFFDPGLIPQSTIAYEARGAVIEVPQILGLSGAQVNCLRRGKIYRYTYRARFVEAATNVRFGMLIKSISGVEIGGAESAPRSQAGIPYVSPGTEFAVEFQFSCLVNAGLYFLNAGILGVREGDETYLHRLLDNCMFRVLPDPDNLATAFVDFHCVPVVTTLASGRGGGG